MAKNVIVVLGAGASVEAGLWVTNELTRRVMNPLVEEERLSEEAAQESYEAALKASESKAEGAPSISYIDTHLAPPRFSMQRLPGPLELVYSALLGHVHSINPLAENPPLDLERLVTLIRQLGQRHTNDLGLFVPEWDRRVSTIGSLPYLGTEGQPVTTGVRFIKEVQLIVNSILHSGGSSRPWTKAEDAIRAQTKSTLESASLTSLEYLQPLVEWASETTSGSIATLNYDHVLESAMDNNQVPWSHGIDSWPQGGGLQWGDSEVEILKLHGSLSWSLPEPRTDFLLGGNNKLTPSGPYIELLAHFYDRVTRADSIVCVGYSARDHHVNMAIRRSLAFKPTHLTFVTYDPTIESGPIHPRQCPWTKANKVPGIPNENVSEFTYLNMKASDYFSSPQWKDASE